MKVKVLGTRGEIEASLPYHSKHSGVLIDRTLLLDLGEKEFLDYEPKYIFITHLHPDHAFFINKKPINSDIPIYAPEPSRDVGGINTITNTVHVDSYTITPIPTHHSKLVKSVAYLIKKGRQRLLYTGDIIWINKEYHHLFSGLNLVITEGSYIRKGGLVRKDKETGQIYGHTGIPDLVNLFKSFTQHVLFVHFGSWFYIGIEAAREKLKKLGSCSGIKLHIGYDGLELDLDKLKGAL